MRSASEARIWLPKLSNTYVRDTFNSLIYLTQAALKLVSGLISLMAEKGK